MYRIKTEAMDCAFGYPIVDVGGETIQEAYRQIVDRAANIPTNRLYVVETNDETDYEEFLGTLENVMLEDDLGRCRKCGCTSDRGCIDGCCWVYPDLCSNCLESDPPEKTCYQQLEKFVRDFDGGVKHFLDCLNIKQCWLDADAISWLNSVLLDSSAALNHIKQSRAVDDEKQEISAK